MILVKVDEVSEARPPAGGKIHQPSTPNPTVYAVFLHLNFMFL